MIVANLATYPARRDGLLSIIHVLAPQLDKLNLVLNEYTEIPEELQSVENLNCLIPDEDTKDVGKFYPDVHDDDHVFLVDDDVEYPEDYVAGMIQKFEALPEGRFLGGLHTSIYQKPKFQLNLHQMRRYARFLVRPHKIAGFRKVTSFVHNLDTPMLVDQVATNSAILRGRDLPPYAYMRNSQKFVDVRLARWCFEQGVNPVALPRDPGWLSTKVDEHSIFLNFTQKHHRHVAKEIWSYAFKKPQVGNRVDMGGPDLPSDDAAGKK